MSNRDREDPRLQGGTILSKANLRTQGGLLGMVELKNNGTYCELRSEKASKPVDPVYHYFYCYYDCHHHLLLLSY